MSNIISFRRPKASAAVIAALVKLGYLQQGQRHRDTAVERAIERLRCDLRRDGVIHEADLSRGGKDRRQRLITGPRHQLMPMAEEDAGNCDKHAFTRKN